MTQNYESFSWPNQIIDGKLVSLRVRIYLRSTEIVANNHEKLVATDGKVTINGPRGFKEHINDYSYVIVSTGICKKSTLDSAEKPYFYLHIKVYLTNQFDISNLKNADFLGSSYVIKALNQERAPELLLTPLQNYFCQKVGVNYEKFYALLKSYAQNNNLDKIEQLFKDYKIPGKYQSIFWKEMYQETNNK